MSVEIEKKITIEFNKLELDQIKNSIECRFNQMSKQVSGIDSFVEEYHKLKDIEFKIADKYNKLL